VTTTTTTTQARPADPPELTLHEELAAIEADTGWTLWLSEDGGIWLQAVTGIVRWAQTPALARHAIAVWEHEAHVRCQLPAVAA
jgi:hypothetical protein